MEMFGVDLKNGRWNANLANQFKPEHVKRIIETYQSASPKMLEGGHNWYEKANTIATKLGKGNVEKGAGIIAALSPQTGWGRNLMLATSMVKTGVAKHTEDNVVKAQRILAGEHPLDVLGGPKVTNFYKNIANPSDPEPITIDRHAHDIPMGIPFRGKKKSTEPSPNLGLDTKGRYKHFQDSYRTAAGELGIEIPHKVQATTWVTHRGAIK
jgi:hypothetical protein